MPRDQLAAQLNGIQYPAHRAITKDQIAAAKAAGLVIVFGGSISRFGMYAPPTAGQRANVIADRIESHNSSPIWQRETQTEMAI